MNHLILLALGENLSGLGFTETVWYCNCTFFVPFMTQVAVPCLSRSVYRRLPALVNFTFLLTSLLDYVVDHLKVRENISVNLGPEDSTFKKITYQPCSD